MKENQTYIAFLRGINVGGHHKVPMADLRKEMENLGYGEVKTLLNSGNVIFNTEQQVEFELEERIMARLSEVFGFDIPVIVVSAACLVSLKEADPFRATLLTKDMKLNVSFLNEDPKEEFPLPFHSEDQSFHILCRIDKSICSALDLSKTGTIKAMEILERTYGKDMTTRNWNTIEKILKLLEN